MRCGHMIGEGILRHSFLSTHIAVVFEHAREVDALHMVSCGIPSEKPLIADGAVAVWNASCLNWILAHKLVEFFRIGKIPSKMTCR